MCTLDYMSDNWINRNLFTVTESHHTQSAVPYRRLFPESFIETIQGGLIFRDNNGIIFQTPPLEINLLLNQISDIEKYFIEKDCRDRNGNIELSVAQQYRINGLRDMMTHPEIWHVTTLDIGKTLYGRNIFSKPHLIKVKDPSALYEGKNNPDTLAYYDPANGNIIIFVDKILILDHPQLIYQKVILHEFIHFLFDIASRDKDGVANKKPDRSNTMNEETADNMLVLFLYEYSLAKNGNYFDIFNMISSFIKKQPKEYNAAIGMYAKYKEKWCGAKKEITNLINAKIK